MKDDTRFTRDRHRAGSRAACLLAAILSVPAAALAGDADSYQHKVLFDPDPAALRAEAGGRIMIYDGLESEEVDRALDEQFERIENMMFIGTPDGQEAGEYEADDDC